MSPVVSVMITSATMHIDTMDATSKTGKPKWNGVDTPTQSASPTLVHDVMPIGIATTVPMTMPSRMDTRASAGGANRSISTMRTSTPAASATFFIGADPSSPPPVLTQPAATLISVNPMMVITVPVTSAGKNLRSLANTGASTIMKMPDAITEP